MSAVRLRQRPPSFTVGAVVQLVRIPACHAGGRGFESRPLRQPYNLAVPSFRAFSSVGRASALQAECRRFDSVNAHHRFTVGAVVQLVRIPACHAGGRGFESRPLRQNIAKPPSGGFLHCPAPQPKLKTNRGITSAAHTSGRPAPSGLYHPSIQQRQAPPAELTGLAFDNDSRQCRDLPQHTLQAADRTTGCITNLLRPCETHSTTPLQSNR